MCRLKDASGVSEAWQTFDKRQFMMSNATLAGTVHWKSDGVDQLSRPADIRLSCFVSTPVEISSFGRSKIPHSPGVPGVGRRPVDLPLRPDRTVQKDLDIAEFTDPEHNPMIPHTLVLKPGLVIHRMIDGEGSARDWSAVQRCRVGPGPS